MIRNHKPLPVLALILSLTIDAIVGCSPASQATPTSVPTSQAASATVEPTEETAAATPESAEENATTSAENAATAEAATCAKLNLNDLTEDELMATIPNFSNRMVREFFEYRPYISIQQFRREIGKYVDDTQVAEYEQYVYVPVDPNESDADTLMQLPGVDETIAETLIGARPYASTDAFLEALAGYVSAEQVAVAECYLAAAS